MPDTEVPQNGRELEEIDVFVYSALANLDYITLQGKQIKVTASKHSTVQMPKEGTVVSGLCWLCLTHVCGGQHNTSVICCDRLLMSNTRSQKYREDPRIQKGAIWASK